MKQYKAAIVGYGGMGRWHKTGICQTPRVCIDGVYDINPARMDAAREDAANQNPEHAGHITELGRQHGAQ